MPAGFNATLNTEIVNNMLGRATQDLNIAFRNVKDTQDFLLSHDPASLIALGYDQADVDVMKSALADLDQLRRIYEGEEALAEAKDFTAFAKRLYGTGFTGQ